MCRYSASSRLLTALALVTALGAESRAAPAGVRRAALPDGTTLTVVGVFYGTRRSPQPAGARNALTIWTTRAGDSLVPLSAMALDSEGRAYPLQHFGRGGTGPPPDEAKEEWVLSPAPPLGSVLRIRISLQSVSAPGGLEFTIPYTDEWQRLQFDGQDLDSLMAEAANRWEADIIWLLLGRRARVHVTGLFDCTPLMTAAARGDLCLVNELAHRGAPLDARNTGGATALYYAIVTGQHKVVALLLSRGADPNLRVFYATPLMWAAHYGEAASVQSLLAGGANVNWRNNRGETALSSASSNRYSEVVRILKRAGAKE